MEQKKTLVVVACFPDGYPSPSLATIETADGFGEFVEHWGLEGESAANSWIDLSSTDAEVFQEHS